MTLFPPGELIHLKSDLFVRRVSDGNAFWVAGGSWLLSLRTWEDNIVGPTHTLLAETGELVLTWQWRIKQALMEDE